MTTDTNTNQPVAEVRLGTVRAAIWANPGKYGPIHSVQIDRSYRDQDGKTQHTTGFGFRDLLLASKVLDMAHSKIAEMIAEDRDHAEQLETV